LEKRRQFELKIVFCGLEATLCHSFAMSSKKRYQ